MAVEGVLLSNISVGHFSNDTLNKSTTIFSSGIKFCEKWILTQGTSLLPIKSINKIIKSQSYKEFPDIYITCEENKSNFSVSVGKVRYAWRSSVLENVVNGMLNSWTIGPIHNNDDKENESGNDVVSLFFLIEIPGNNESTKELNYKEALMELFKLLSPHSISRGEQIYIESTPFGNEVFLNCRTDGVVCSSVGDYNEILLCDASSAVCSEGAPVFTLHNKLLSGIVLSTLSWCRGEWVGLTLVGALRPILQSVLYPNNPINIVSHPKAFAISSAIDLIDLSIALVRCGEIWGSGLILPNDYIITCSHVITNKKNQITVFVYGELHKARLVYQSPGDMAYDLAILKCDSLKTDPESVLNLAETPTFKGERVIAVGYPFFSERHYKDIKPTITKGTISKVSPYMIQTTCCVQSGFSGGCILRIRRLHNQNIVCEVIGIIVCNVRNDENKVTYPNINIAIPITVFKKTLDTFLKTEDSKILTEFEFENINNKNVQSLWRLQAPKSLL